MSEVRLIDANALKEVFEEHEDRRGDLDCDWRTLIDNAPTVDKGYDFGYADGHGEGYELGKNSRPQGECRTCTHRDPEDKKCDCGGLERQGCPFPVSDDYFCKFYEKGGAE